MDKILKRVEMIRVLSEPSSSTNNGLLYPETMNESDLIRLFNERFVKMDNLHNLSKDDLVKLAYRFCVPRPQREYRTDTRRGNQVNSTRLICSNRSKSTDNPMDVDSPSNSELSDKNVKKRESSTSSENGSSKRRKHSPIKFP